MYNVTHCKEYLERNNFGILRMLSSIHTHEERRLVGVREGLGNFDMHNTVIVLNLKDIVNTCYNLSLKSKSPKHGKFLSQVGFHVTLHRIKDGLFISSNLLRISKSTARHFNKFR